MDLVRLKNVCLQEHFSAASCEPDLTGSVLHVYMKSLPDLHTDGAISHLSPLSHWSTQTPSYL